jgi:Ni/Fe-hydrogenase subunit HybB-like protein
MASIFAASALVILGVVLNRIDMFLVAYKPLYPVKTYFPSPFEIAVTVGLVSTLVLVYRAIVMIFPVIQASSKGDVSGYTIKGAILTKVNEGY